MFVYCRTQIDRPFDQVESKLLQMLPKLEEWAENAYRDGEHLCTRLGPLKDQAGIDVHMTVGAVSRSATESAIPLDLQASGTANAFSRMRAEVIATALGISLTQLSFRATYYVSQRMADEAIDRMRAHRLVQAGAKAFLHRIAAGLEEPSRANALAGV